jgi:hypothetical protein
VKGAGLGKRARREEGLDPWNQFCGGFSHLSSLMVKEGQNTIFPCRPIPLTHWPGAHFSRTVLWSGQTQGPRMVSAEEQEGLQVL